MSSRNRREEDFTCNQHDDRDSRGYDGFDDRKRSGDDSRYKDDRRYGDRRSHYRDYKDDYEYRRRSPSPRRTPPKDYHRERSRRSPSPRTQRSVDPASTVWSAGSSRVVVLRRIPPKIMESEIRMELSKFGAPLKNLKMISDGGGESSEHVCYIEFTDVADSARWMHHNQGCLKLQGEFISMSYTDSNVPRDDFDSYSRGRYDDRDRYREKRRFDQKPTETMIVKGLDRETDIEGIRKAFAYITQFKIVDIRMVRDKFGNSRGFCFVQWETVEECKQVLEYLQMATPRFHIDGRQVVLDYSQPRYPEKPTYAAANAAIQAAQWSQSAIEAAVETAANQGPAQVYSGQPPIQAQPAKMAPTSGPVTQKRYPSPDTTKYKYDKASGYYYDPTTQLYYDANSRYYYNGITRQYMYWDQPTHTYKPMTNEQHADAMKNVNKTDENTSQKSNDNNSTTPAKSITKTAKEIAKDMERWAKSQNKKSETKKLTDDSQEKMKKTSATADAVFGLLEKKTSEIDRQKALQDAYEVDNFKKPLALLTSAIKPSNAKPGLVSYQQGSDSEEELDNEAEEQLIDWEKLTCLLCRRKFAKKEQLTKHENVSELHKTNLEARNARKQPQGKRALNDEPTLLKYRDRAAERRNKYGTPDIPPDTKKFKFAQPSVPYEQPTVNGIGESNIGNRMLQKMGWNKGKGLGKTQSGITAPIMAEQRSLGAGLGSKGSKVGAEGGNYRDNLKKLTALRYNNEL